MDILVKAHSGLRWVVLILLIIAVANAFMKKGKNSFTSGDKKIYLFTLIFVHLQLLLGIILYFTSSKVTFEYMFANAMNRFYGMEHTLGMLIAIALITIGYSKSKKISEANAKHKKISVFYLFALIIILLSIPWPFRQLGAGWF
jgi:heme A synthase